MSKKKPAAVTVPARAVAEAGDTALCQQVRDVLLRARQHAWRAVNTAMVQAYWEIGRYIVESEQGGEARATYGQSILAALSARLSAEFGRGYSLVNLKYFRQF